MDEFDFSLLNLHSQKYEHHFVTDGFPERSAPQKVQVFGTLGK